MSTNDYEMRPSPPSLHAVERVAAMWGDGFAHAIFHTRTHGEAHGGTQFCVLDGKVQEMVYSMMPVTRRYVPMDPPTGVYYQFLSPTGGVLPWSAVDEAPDTAVSPALPAAPPETPLSPAGVGLYRITAEVAGVVERLVVATSAEDARTMHDDYEAAQELDAARADVEVQSVSRVTVAEVRAVQHGHPARDNPDVWITDGAHDALAQWGAPELDEVDPHLDDVVPYLVEAP